MTVKFKLDSRAVPDGTILVLGIRYEAQEHPRPHATVYEYVVIKARGHWYMTGGGRTPQVAGWGAIERWLAKDGRVVEWVRHVTETAQLWPPVSWQTRLRDESIHDDGRPCLFIAGACNLCGATPPLEAETEPASESRRCPCGLTGFAAPELHRPGCTG